MQNKKHHRYNFDEISSRHKIYEKTAPSIFMKGLPIVCRLDGKKFSRWTKGLRYPYDERLQLIREECLKWMMNKTNAKISYSQSDEFSFILYDENIDADLMFGGRRDKLNSIFAAMLTAKFNELVAIHIPEKASQLAFFDCRTYQTPNLDIAAEAIIWREMDCTKNSISMLTRAHYSAKEMHKKNRVQQFDMQHAKGVYWNNTPTWFRRGTYVKKVSVLKPLESSVRETLEIKGRDVPDSVIRTVATIIEFPVITKVDNVVDLFFRKEDRT